MRSPWFGSGRSVGAEASVELAVLAAIAEDRFDLAARDRLARALRDRSELSGVDWDWALGRADALTLEAPLFTEARDRIAAQLQGTEHAQSAIALAAGVVGQESGEDARYLIADVAERIGVRLPEETEPLPGLVRCSANDPEVSTVRTFVDALAHATGAERRLLLFKLQASRQVARRLGAGSRLLELGHQVPVGPFVLRFDARIAADGKVFHCRFLALQEALHPGEHLGLPRSVENLGLGQHLLLAHDGPMVPPDESVWATLDPGLAPRFEI